MEFIIDCEVEGMGCLPGLNLLVEVGWREEVGRRMGSGVP